MTTGRWIAASSIVLMSLSATALADTGRYIGDENLSAPAIAPGSESSKMDAEPYSASYLPKKEGELSRKNDPKIKSMINNGFGDCDLVHQAIKDNANKPTSEKFDIAITNNEHKNPGLTADYNENGYDKKAKYWEGFCHLWSPAGLDPNVAFVISMDKIYGKVPFGIGDLKELSTYTYPDPDSLFFGKRNYGRGSKKVSENLDPIDLLTMFHEYVGPGKPGLVLDIDPTAEVWNQPFYSWKQKTTELKGDDAKGAPKDGHAYKVELSSKYAKESEYAYRGKTYLYDLAWVMTVFTDKDGKVVDSKFVKDESDDVPDFGWVPNGKITSDNLKRLERIAKRGIAVKDIEAFCEGMQGLTKSKFHSKAPELAKILKKICPVLDQNDLSDYIQKTAKRTGIDFSALDSALRDPPADNS